MLLLFYSLPDSRSEIFPFLATESAIAFGIYNFGTNFTSRKECDIFI